EPADERTDLLAVPKRREIARVVHVEHIAFLSREPQGLDEAIAAFARPAVVGETGETEMLVAAFDEMLGAEMTERDIVGPDLGHAGKRIAVVQVHEWELQLGAGLHEGGRGVAADDAVPFFAAKPFRIALRAGF